MNFKISSYRFLVLTLASVGCWILPGQPVVALEVERHNEDTSTEYLLSEISLEDHSFENKTEDEQLEGCIEDCATVGEWQFGLAFGLGYVETPIAEEQDLKLPILPRFSYYGESFFVDNFTLGYNLMADENYRFDIIGEFNQDFLHFQTASHLQKAFAVVIGRRGEPFIINPGDYDLKDRHASYLIGPSFKFQSEYWNYRISYKKDAFNVSNGEEFLFEVGQQFNQGNWNFEHGFGLIWKSEEIVDYYYGLDAEESPALITIYEPESAATNLFYRLNSQYQISEQWRFLLSLKVEKLDKPITESNIINKETINSIFVGFGYAF